MYEIPVVKISERYITEIWLLSDVHYGHVDFDEEHFFEKAPLGRYGTPDEVATLALFLASDESSYINGAIVRADGGITITPIS